MEQRESCAACRRWQVLSDSVLPSCPPADVDVFALGMLLQAIVIGQHIRRGGQANLLPPELCPAPIARLIEACISLDAQERPSAAQVEEDIRRTMEQTHSGSGTWRPFQSRDWHLHEDHAELLQEVELSS